MEAPPVRALGIAGIVLGLLQTVASPVAASTDYHVRIELPQSTVDSLHLVFDLTSSDLLPNSLTVTGLVHDGRAKTIESVGGPASGTVLRPLMPSDSVALADRYFLNELTIPLDSLGTHINFSVSFATLDTASLSGPDAVAFFIIDRSTGTPLGTVDPLGSDALFAITSSDGELEVFSPMSFI